MMRAALAEVQPSPLPTDGAIARRRKSPVNRSTRPGISPGRGRGPRSPCRLPYGLMPKVARSACRWTSPRRSSSILSPSLGEKRCLHPSACAAWRRLSCSSPPARPWPKSRAALSVPGCGRRRLRLRSRQYRAEKPEEQRCRLPFRHSAASGQCGDLAGRLR